MSENLQSQTHLHFSQRDTEELLRIWSENDRFEWSEMTFDVIGEILQERGVDPPPQGKPVYESHKLKSAVVREAPQEPHGAPPAEDEAADEVYEPRGTVSDRPKTVIYAVYLALGALVIGAALAVVNLATGQLKALAAYPEFGAIIGLIGVGFLLLDAFLLYGTWRGRNVARILYVGLTLVSTVSTMTSGGWAEGFATQPLRAGLSTLPVCLDLVAVILLVLPASNAWFRELRASRVVGRASRGKKLRQRKRKAPTWPVELSPDGWVRRYAFGTVAVSFAVGLLASWLVFNLVLYLQQSNYPKYPFDPFPNIMYAMSCLPAQAIAFILGAVIGAVSTRIPEERWRRATYGVWIVGILAIVSAVVGAGVLPRSGS